MTAIGNRTGQNWNRDETVLALYLYSCLSFGQISQRNRQVIELAKLLGRSPGSVGLKLQNLAHHDPQLQERNIVAMAHGSKLDKEIFSEFKNNWEDLACQAADIKARLLERPAKALLTEDDMDLVLPPGLTVEQQYRARVGQGFFRNAVLNSYDNKCCITGLDKRELLIASHIKPWKDSNEQNERTNPKNGLCLNALHDKAFDKGLITVTKNYEIIISPALQEAYMDDDTKNWFMSYAHKFIQLPDKRYIPAKEFLEYHNDVIFIR